MQQTDLKPFLDHLLNLSFVKTLRVAGPSGNRRDWSTQIKTAAGTFDFVLEAKRSYLDRSLTNAIISKARTVKGQRGQGLLLMARYVPRPTGERLADAGVNFVDLAGNLNLSLGGHYRSLILGRPQTDRAREKRKPGYAAVQMLFALAAEPDAANWTTRRLAAFAGISKTVAAEVRSRLAQEGAVQKLAKGGYRIPNLQMIHDQCISGYSRILRPHLLIGRFRSLERDPEGFVEQFSSHMRRAKIDWALTGGPAAYALNRFYRGPETPIYLTDVPEGFKRELMLLPDEDGPIILMQSFGPLVFWKTVGRAQLAHPWLIYAELVHQDNPRAHEAAEALRKDYLSQ